MRPGCDTTDSIYIPDPYKVCGLIEMGESYREKPGAVACVVDGSGFYAALCVSEDFGCNQWTAKERIYGTSVLTGDPDSPMKLPD